MTKKNPNKPVKNKELSEKELSEKLHLLRKEKIEQASKEVDEVLKKHGLRIIPVIQMNIDGLVKTIPVGNILNGNLLYTIG